MTREDGEREGDVGVIVPAAGSSERMGGPVRKPFLEIGGEPILFRTCRRLAAVPGVREIIVALHPGDLDFFRDRLEERARAAGITLAVAGGECRAESVWNALQVMSARAELAAVHDAARPFFPSDTVRALFDLARRRGAAIPVIPLTDAPKLVEGDRVTGSPARRGLMRAQTPQVFRSDLLIEAYEFALRTGGLSAALGDDAQLVEALGA
ncbi:MAG: 2-C-methyl-D-erythritol 4-phosphate cytidylyltransferase, partial [Planctomycetota bacterium]|nr:2-C-methyl-D-erythritol 4-phosphate cytidylyltransferase [Planctomycetota bacterium]